MQYYNHKDTSYHTGIRMDIISLLPKNTEQKVLEIGAGGGDTLVYIKKHKLAQEVVGLELFELAGTNQNNPLIDQFIHGNIEESQSILKQKYFDVIILADVLEHLVDPWTVLEKVCTYLKDDGKLLVSLPNIREIGALVKIALLGDFRYQNDGVLDKTHLRFFCKKNMLNMLESNEHKVDSFLPAFKVRHDRKKRKLYNNLTFGLMEGLWAYQYLFVVSKKVENAG